MYLKKYRTFCWLNFIGFNQFRAVWNVKSTKNLTLYLVPKGKDDDHEDVMKIKLNPQLGDSNPEKLDNVGEFELKIKDENDEIVIEETPTVFYDLKLGASYEFLVQYDDPDDNSTPKPKLVTKY